MTFDVVEESTRALHYAEAFLETLRCLDRHPLRDARTLFDPAADLVVTRAPGRLDLMGGIADYSGSLVLQLPIRQATFAALQKAPDRSVHVLSLGGDTNGRAASFVMSLEQLESGGLPVDYATARAFFRREPERRWAAYVAGAFLVLMRERGVVFDAGARLLIASDVPEGKGVSSSAALEVATMRAIAAAFDIRLQPRELALLAQTVENEVVGAPCGVMDQMTAVCGEQGRLLALLCQPAELQGTIALPEELTVWGLDSGVRHAVSGADYTSVRVGAFMGYRMIADLAGLRAIVEPGGTRVQIEDLRWNGYLANVTPAEFRQDFRAGVPPRLRGEEFLARYGGTTDAATVVDADRDYAVRVPTAHPIDEHFRVRCFAELLDGPPGERRAELLGELMYQSHASYSRCGLGSAETDRLVALVRSAGHRAGLYGAKITGGGSGGTVAVLGRGGADAVVATIAEQFAEETGHMPQVFSGSSPGAAAVGALRLRAR
jgi:galactokinase